MFLVLVSIIEGTTEKMQLFIKMHNFIFQVGSKRLSEDDNTSPAKQMKPSKVSYYHTIIYMNVKSSLIKNAGAFDFQINCHFSTRL